MIFFNGPCDLRIARDGNRIIVTGSAARAESQPNLTDQNRIIIRALLQWIGRANEST